MEGRRRVLSRANGTPGAFVMFIAEAPGRRGGEVTGVPLSRDVTGQRFERLLAAAGLRRADVFITNAVLCNPQTATGLNRAPSCMERENCRPWLLAQIEAVDPPVIATLGAVALAALDAIEAHGLRLSAAAGSAVVWRGRTLAPLYHPSPRAGIHRCDAQQEADFRALGSLVARLRASA